VGWQQIVARAHYLVDTSAMVRVDRAPVASAIAPMLADGLVALCGPVIFELGFSARNQATHQSLMDRVDAFERAPTTDGDHRRAVEIQSALAQQGQHRAVSMVDALVASVAETRNLTVLHYDKDFDLIAAVTGQQMKWVVPQGSVA